jgi:hypothetical protein
VAIAGTERKAEDQRIGVDLVAQLPHGHGRVDRFGVRDQRLRVVGLPRTVGHARPAAGIERKQDLEIERAGERAQRIDLGPRQDPLISGGRRARRRIAGGKPGAIGVGAKEGEVLHAHRLRRLRLRSRPRHARAGGAAALEQRHQLLVFASGMAYDMLAQQRPVVRVPPLEYRYARSALAVGATLRHNLGAVTELLCGGARLDGVLACMRDFAPDVAICDVEPWTHRAAARLGVPRISFGKPLLVMPEDSVEQHVNAAAVERCGIGVRADHRRLTAESLRAFLAAEEQHADRARWHARDGRAEALAALERFVHELAPAPAPTRLCKVA